MKVVSLVFVVYVSATLAQNSSLPEESDEDIAQVYVEKFNLTFSCPTKRLAAVKNLAHAHRKVHAHNQLFAQRKANFVSKVYPMHVMTHQQIVETRTGLLVKPNFLRTKRSVPQSIANPLLCTNPPASVDWFAKGNVAPVQNQGQCGSCYIFAGVSVLESAVSIKYGTAPLKLSEQELTECISYPPNGGCSGGWPEWVWNPTKVDGGVVPAASYKPYTAPVLSACNKNIAKAPNTIVDYYLTNPQANEVALKCALNKYGPHSVCMDFSGPISNYRSGIYDDPTANCNSAFTSTGNMVKAYNHAVSLVGYGSELNNAGVMTDYWLIKNSWGASWGMNGFIKIARNKNNLCHIATNAEVPILLSSTSTTTTAAAQCPLCPAAMFATSVINWYALLNTNYPATGVCTAMGKYVVTSGTTVRCCCH